MNIEQLNQLTSTQAEQFFMQCCTSSQWVNIMVKSRPFANRQAITEKANLAWLNLAETDYLEAFAGHPKIGDVNSLRAKYAQTKALAGKEQGLVKEATEETLALLCAGNKAYEEKFGFIFIVCATGKTAEEMSDLLQKRLVNNKKQELINASEEQRKIFQLRIEKALY